jgi:hypothetical protein
MTNIQYIRPSRFAAILMPLSCIIRDASYQIVLTGDYFSWSLYKEYIGPRRLFEEFIFLFVELFIPIFLFIVIFFVDVLIKKKKKRDA